jgi:protein CLEC16A
LLSYITGGDAFQALGSLCLFATLLQTKGFLKIYSPDYRYYCVFPKSIIIQVHVGFTELDESMLDALGILPQRKQHKKLLLVSTVDSHSIVVLEN